MKHPGLKNMRGNESNSDTLLTSLNQKISGAKSMGFLMLGDIPPKKRWIAIGILVIGLVLTILVSFYVKAELEKAARNEFNFICDEIQLNIGDRLDANALILYSGAAIFEASEQVSREEWRTFTNALRIQQQMPGTQGIGFSLIIPPDQLEQHVRTIRKEGFPEYTVKPEGKRDLYTSIIYLEPFSGRNLRAFGYDMYSEPVRRAAMERARDENTAALSGKVILVQETTTDVQIGMLMYVPVYQHKMPISTVEERRAAIQGWVYSPYRMKDMIQGALENFELKHIDRQIDLEIYDGEVISAETLVYENHVDTEKASAGIAAGFSRISRIIAFGRLWTLKFSQPGGMAATVEYDSFWLALTGGIGISALLFALTCSWLRTARYLESIRLLADMDALTGVYNRRKIIDLAENEFNRAKRFGHAFTILMIDLNFFKSINDTYGHTVGDQALRLTARAIQNTLRNDIDQVGRFGGDEFVILLPETRLDQVDPIAARLQANVAENTRTIADGLPPVSLSVGAAALERTTRSLDEMIERADQAMYVDKKRALKNHR